MSVQAGWQGYWCLYPQQSPTQPWAAWAEICYSKESDAVRDWQGPGCKGESCLVVVLQPVTVLPHTPHGGVPLSQSTQMTFGELQPCLLSGLSIWWVIPTGYFLFCLRVCMSVVTSHPLLVELAGGLLCSGALGACQDLQGWQCWHSPPTMNPSLILFYDIFILALPLTVRGVCIRAFLLLVDLVQLNHPSPWMDVPWPC